MTKCICPCVLGHEETSKRFHYLRLIAKAMNTRVDMETEDDMMSTESAISSITTTAQDATHISGKEMLSRPIDAIKNETKGKAGGIDDNVGVIVPGISSSEISSQTLTSSTLSQDSIDSVVSQV